MSQGTSPGLATANVTWADPAFSDNVQVRTIIRTRNPGVSFVQCGGSVRG